MTTLASFRSRLEQMLAPTGRRDWSDAALDAALRQARDRYSTILPPKSISTLTLPSDGREIDISSFTYTHIERVWWDYDSCDPRHPPEYRDFEIWPGNILYISDPDEPATGDVIRCWLVQRATIADLDSSAATNVPAEHDTLLLTGATGYALTALAGALAETPNVDGWVTQRLENIASKHLTAFTLQLETLARQRGSRDAGMATGPKLDRWDDKWA